MKRHIPPEILTEILCGLPVKSLLRFRCVSTSWLALIDNAEFARLHLKNFKNNCDEAHLLAVERRQRNCVVRCSDTFETNSETLLTLGDNFFEGAWEFVCSMDGLVLLKRIRIVLIRFKDLKVWNPSIRKFHEIPSLPATITSPYGCCSQFMDVDIGLGYDPLANDYKHVKLMRVHHNTSVAVYSLGAGSWKIIPLQGKDEMSSWHWDLVHIGLNKVYLRGSLYFTAYAEYNYDVEDLVSFDLSSELFSSIRLPAFKGRSKLMLIDGGCSIALLDTRSMWVLESSRNECEPM